MSMNCKRRFARRQLSAGMLTLALVIHVMCIPRSRQTAADRQPGQIKLPRSDMLADGAAKRSS
jgi:hypothetical protein